jgi:hypothetical protein
MKQICQSKYEQDIAEQEYQLLQKQIAYFNLPSQSFDSSSLSHSPLIDSITNASVRQVVLIDFKKIAEQSRTILLNFYLKTAADHREECKKNFETNINQLQSNQHSNEHTQKLSPIMIQLIHERCEKTSARIQCIYKFKTTSSISTFK